MSLVGRGGTMPCRWSHTRLRTKPAAMHQSGRARARTARSCSMACTSPPMIAAMSSRSLAMSATRLAANRELQDDAGEHLERRHARTGLQDRVLRLDEDVQHPAVRALEHAPEPKPDRHDRIEAEIEGRDAGRTQIVATGEVEEEQGLDGQGLEAAVEGLL